MEASQTKNLLRFGIVLLSITSVAALSPELLDNFRYTRPNTSAETQKKAVLGLISRVLPSHANLIKVEIDFNLKENTYILQKFSHIPFLLIIASNGVSACKGLHYYMKYKLNLHVSWSGNRIEGIPDELPEIHINSTSKSRFVYYQNVCTWSYSFAWWQESQWRRHVDWMALMGISLTIAPIQEAVWERIYKQVGMTDTEINDHFAGPAFQAWQRMGNIRGWGGPLSGSYRYRQLNLQKVIIKYQRDLGMTVAVPAFAGHVPVAFKRIYPNATLLPVDCWNKFSEKYCCPLFIDPADPLFTIIGTKFLHEIINEYGTDHVYFSDPFNEIQPKVSSAEYLRKTARSIYNSMLIDGDAVWLLQGWMFVKNPFWSDELIESFLTAVPRGKMLILDLQSEQFPQFERTKSYYGQPFIWCMLHNFGGTLGMHGSVNLVDYGISGARTMINSTMLGVGITPEGLNPNYALYEFALEKGWGIDVNPTQWFFKYSDSRYGEYGVLREIWISLLSTVYSYEGLIKLHGKYTICRRPSIRISPWTWYNVSTFETTIWKRMITEVDPTTYNSNPLLQHDLVDITRQVLQNRFDQVYLNMMDAYHKKNRSIVSFLGEVMKELILDMDCILRTNSEFLFGKWIKDARDLAGGYSREARVYEVNARNQISTWGPNGEIVDYATKQWSGMVEGYFLKRWNLFIVELKTCLDNNTRFDEDGFKQKVLERVENPFNVEYKNYPITPTGAAYLIAKRIYNKWDHFDSKHKLSVQVPRMWYANRKNNSSRFDYLHG